MKLLKNKSIILLFVAFVFFVLLILMFLFVYIKDGRNELLTKETVNLNESEEEADSPISQLVAKDIIRSLFSSEENKGILEITIIKASTNYIKANLIDSFGGSYILALNINGAWQKVFRGNGIPKCVDVSRYGFPADIVPACIDEYNGDIITNEWPLIKSLIANCEVREVMQAHSLYVSIELKDGSKIVGFEPKIDDIIHLAVEAQKKCGKIFIATE